MAKPAHLFYFVIKITDYHVNIWELSSSLFISSLIFKSNLNTKFLVLYYILHMENKNKFCV